MALRYWEPAMGRIDYDAIERAGGLGKGTTRYAEKLAKRAKEAAAIRDCHNAVDARDHSKCRVCKRACSPKAVSMIDKAERHHMVYRSQGGDHDSRNVVTLCRPCHDAIHRVASVRVSGDADLRDERGQLAGVKVERLTESGWVVEKFV